MGGPEKKIDCVHHGACAATFACIHLARGVGCGYFPAGEPPGDPWPDAWCAACEAVRAREGGWNDASEGFARITLMCSGCYEEARDRNAGPPETAGLGAPASPGEIARFLETCRQRARERNEEAWSRFGLSHHERWDFDADAGTLSFGSGGRVEVVGDVRLAGSYSNRTRTWLWAWANTQNPPHLIRESRRLRVFGEVRGIAAMTADVPVPATPEDAWEHASVATVLLGGQALYRAPMDHLDHFMVLGNLRRPG